MFRTSYVHHQEDYIAHAALCGVFLMHLCKQSSRLKDVICYIWILQLGWHPVAVVQYTFTHKQYTEQHNETQYLERNIHNNKNI
jgi:hypothetical protein